MNILKRIGSFASNSWREFCEYQEGKEENVQECQASSGDTSKTNLVVKSSGDEENVVRRRPGLFHKRNSKKKLLEDPRSPSYEIKRTPMPELQHVSFDANQGKFDVFLDQC